MTTGEDVRRMMDALRQAEHPLPEVMDVEEMEPLSVEERSSLVHLLQRLAYLRGLASRRVRRPQRSGRR